MSSFRAVALFSIVLHCRALSFTQNTKSQSHLEQCTAEILRLYVKSGDNTIFSNFGDNHREVPQNVSIIIQNQLQDLKYFQWIRANFYIIAIPQGHFAAVFDFLTLTISWNPRAKFVLLLEEVSRDFLVVLKHYFVYNILFLVAKNESYVKITTYYPFRIASSDFHTIAECRHGKLWSDQDLFPDKLPKDWRNFRVRTILFNFPPLVIMDGGRRTGIEVDLFKLVENHLGLKVEYVDKSFDNWGRKLPNGSYEGAYGFLRRYDVEVALGSFYANASEYWDFDQSYPYLVDDTKWVVPAAKREEHWVGIVKIFQISIWVYTFISFLSIAMVLYASGFQTHAMGKYRSFFYSLLTSYKLFFGQSSALPSSSAIRLPLGLWIAISLIITSTFQGRLISVLNFTHTKNQITSISELRQSNISFGYYKDYAFLYSNPGEKDNFLAHNFIDCPIDLHCLNRTAFNADFATIKPKWYVQYLISTIYLGPDGRPLVYMFKDNIYKLLLVMAFPKGFPVLPAVNKMLLHLRVHGFISMHYHRASYIGNRAIQSAKRQELSGQVIDMNDVFWVFCLLFFGLATAKLVFILELLVFKYV